MAVTGRVWAPKPLRCELSEGQGAIVVVLEERAGETRSNDAWLPDARALRQYTREVPWALADGSGPFAVHLPVQDGSRAAQNGGALALSADQFLPANEGLVELVVSQLMGHRVLGFRRREHYLPQGAEVTVVGELDLAGASDAGSSVSLFKAFKDEHGRALVLRAPTASAPFVISQHRLPRMLADAQRFSLVAGRLGSIFLITGGTMLLMSLHLRLRRARREAAASAAAAAARARREAARAAGGSATNGANEEEDGERRGICVACYENAARLVYPRCGHLCLCERCRAALGSTAERCPICRERGPPIKVFLA